MATVQIDTYKKEWITTGEAGKRLGYSPKHIRTLCKENKLINKRSEDGQYRVSTRDVDRMLNEELKRGCAG